MQPVDSEWERENSRCKLHIYKCNTYSTVLPTLLLFLFSTPEYTVPMLWIICADVTIIHKYKLTYCQVNDLSAWVGEMCGKWYKHLITRP